MDIQKQNNDTFEDEMKKNFASQQPQSKISPSKNPEIHGASLQGIRSAIAPTPHIISVSPHRSLKQIVITSIIALIGTVILITIGYFGYIYFQRNPEKMIQASLNASNNVSTLTYTLTADTTVIIPHAKDEENSAKSSRTGKRRMAI